jgi:hypothetical protein
MSAVAVCFDPHRIVREVVRHLRIIAAVVIIAVALHQIGGELVSCFTGSSSPDPIVCNAPEVVLPHVDNEKPDPGSLLVDKPSTIVTSATSVTPCFNGGPKDQVQGG